MWTVVIVDILDLASPRIGAFRANAAVYDWTLQGFKGGLRSHRSRHPGKGGFSHRATMSPESVT